MYKWQRVVAMDGLVALPIWPTRGVIAETSTATYEVKAFFAPGISEWTEKLHCHRSALTIHIDGSTLNEAQLGFFQCISMMRDKAKALAHLVTQQLGVPLSYTKLAVAGSSPALVEAARAAMGELAGVPEDFPKNLGVDNSLGKHKHRAGARKVRQKRFHNIPARMRKLKTIKAP
eukprot:5192869-Pyramimonas_sp.AAC.1